MKKLFVLVLVFCFSVSPLLADSLQASTGDFLQFSFDSLLYYQPESEIEFTGNAFTISFPAADNLRVGIYQENADVNLDEAAGSATDSFRATALNLEYDGLVANPDMDVLLGFNLGSARVDGTSVGTTGINAGAALLSDIYVKLGKSFNSAATVHTKLGYRMLGLDGQAEGSSFSNLNDFTLQLGFSLRF